jgi:hypothetical protein
MTESGETVKEALAIEAESVQEVEAALAEKQGGQPMLSTGLLLEAIEKERHSLDLMEQGIETLRQAIEERRHALEQQEMILNQLVEDLTSDKKQLK